MYMCKKINPFLTKQGYTPESELMSNFFDSVFKIFIKSKKNWRIHIIISKSAGAAEFPSQLTLCR